MSDRGVPFPGFPPAAMTFLADLKANNDRAWFSAHRDVFETTVRAPAELLVAVLAPELEAISGRPITPKIFRIHRDVRFSKDKSPYNAHLHVGFALGEVSAKDRSSACGYYLGLEADQLHLGAGAFEFAGVALDRYRAAVARHPEGEELNELARVLAAAGFRLKEPELKRVPAPYPPDHIKGDMLRRKGLTAWRILSDRRLIESDALFEDVMSSFVALTPLNRWISEAIG